ncbi:mechanosensitive ion channel family protein [Melittangium boletus]|uniref:Mechanosensitive ion channel protein MscS n=1 Tax=Melittangium boletus DSM 14713 TaxID=1294270 RepID=A0A250I9T7_9BACT|nr:mechanosensitive ion channel domain-containing protein [Melittangium boletus]ATB27897.1 mechanosensitive ion channel protein MscS [Melittangium boletus DSM 14713]
MRRTLTGLSLLLSVLVSWKAWALNAGLGAPPARMDRQTPYATANGFSDAVHQGDYERAAHYLYLDFLSPSVQKAEGARLARQLKFVLDHKLPLTALASLSKEPEGDPDSARFDQIGVIPVGDDVYPIRLTRVTLPDGGKVWVFGEATVKSIEPLYERYGPVLLGEELPAVLFARPVLGLEPWQWLGLLLTVVGASALSVILERLSLRVLARLARWTSITWDDALVASGRGPAKALYFALLLALGAHLLLLPPTAQSIVDHLNTTLSIIAVAWFLLRFLRMTAQFVQESVAHESSDAGRLRGLRTQLSVLRSVFEAATYLIASALLLMQFETVRNVGVSLLASAGLAGIVIGLAAQKPVASLLAGIQISITQPIRIGDRVVIEGEFGTVDEITLTYVVVKVWDERRLIIPISQFLDKPFQNWSKGGQSMLGVVRLLVDFSTDLDELRAELRRILENEGKELWDGKVSNMVVEDVLDRTLQVRVLVSGKPGILFDLRALVREQLMRYLRARPHWLPTTRTEARAAITPMPPPKQEEREEEEPSSPLSPPRA